MSTKRKTNCRCCVKTDAVLTSVAKQRFFQLAKRENYPKTPKITAELDKLQRSIRQKARTE